MVALTRILHEESPELHEKSHTLHEIIAKKQRISVFHAKDEMIN